MPLQLRAYIVRDPSVARFARDSSPFRGAEKTHPCPKLGSESQTAEIPDQVRDDGKRSRHLLSKEGLRCAPTTACIHSARPLSRSLCSRQLPFQGSRENPPMPEARQRGFRQQRSRIKSGMTEKGRATGDRPPEGHLKRRLPAVCVLHSQFIFFTRKALPGR